MRLTVFGATGGTGRLLVGQALERGDDVTAVVRDPRRLGVEHDALTVVTADVTDTESIASAVKDADAVLSALGHRGGRGAPATICAEGTRSVVAAMHAAGARRLLVVSAAGAVTDGDGPFSRLVVKPLLKRMLRDAFADLLAMEDEVRRSGLDWTVVRPPRLTDAEPTRRYRATVGANVRGGFRISRADLADALLRLAADSSTVGHAVGVAV